MADASNVKTYSNTPVAGRSNFVTSAARARESVALLADRVRNLADRCCGATPPVDGSKATLQPSGAFASVDAAMSDINDLVGMATAALSRIEDQLPTD